MSVPSETSILSYCSIFLTHTNIHLKKRVDNLSSSSKTDLKIIVNVWSFSVLFKNKLSSELNLTFITFLYSPALPTFIVSTSFLIPFQSSAHSFVNLLNSGVAIHFS